MTTPYENFAASPEVRTNDPTMAFMAKLDDLSKWKVIENAPIFVPHERDAKGKNGEDIKINVGVDDLGPIAEQINMREQEFGVPPLLTIGHRQQTNPNFNEKNQPDVIGCVRHARMGVFGPKATPAVLADLYVQVEHWDEAKKYPFRSVDFYPGSNKVTGVALLKRDPFLPMGVIMYQAQGKDAAMLQSKKTLRAPNGGITLDGYNFRAGMYIPPRYAKKMTEAQRAQCLCGDKSVLRESEGKTKEKAETYAAAAMSTMSNGGLPAAKKPAGKPQSYAGPVAAPSNLGAPAVPRAGVIQRLLKSHAFRHAALGSIGGGLTGAAVTGISGGDSEDMKNAAIGGAIHGGMGGLIHGGIQDTMESGAIGAAGRRVSGAASKVKEKAVAAKNAVMGKTAAPAEAPVQAQAGGSKPQTYGFAGAGKAISGGLKNAWANPAIRNAVIGSGIGAAGSAGTAAIMGEDDPEKLGRMALAGGVTGGLGGGLGSLGAGGAQAAQPAKKKLLKAIPIQRAEVLPPPVVGPASPLEVAADAARRGKSHMNVATAQKAPPQAVPVVKPAMRSGPPAADPATGLINPKSPNAALGGLKTGAVEIPAAGVVSPKLGGSGGSPVPAGFGAQAAKPKVIRIDPKIPTVPKLTQEEMNLPMESVGSTALQSRAKPATNKAMTHPQKYVAPLIGMAARTLAPMAIEAAAPAVIEGLGSQGQSPGQKPGKLPPPPKMPAPVKFAAPASKLMATEKPVDYNLLNSKDWQKKGRPQQGHIQGFHERSGRAGTFGTIGSLAGAGIGALGAGLMGANPLHGAMAGNVVGGLGGGLAGAAGIGRDSLGFSEDAFTVGYEAAHAPAGGVTVAGRKFVGGQFIPAEVMDQASPEEKKKLKKAGGNEGGKPGPRSMAQLVQDKAKDKILGAIGGAAGVKQDPKYMTPELKETLTGFMDHAPKEIRKELEQHLNETLTGKVGDYMSKASPEELHELARAVRAKAMERDERDAKDGLIPTSKGVLDQGRMIEQAVNPINALGWVGRQLIGKRRSEALSRYILPDFIKAPISTTIKKVVGNKEGGIDKQRVIATLAVVAAVAAARFAKSKYPGLYKLDFTPADSGPKPLGPGDPGPMPAGKPPQAPAPTNTSAPKQQASAPPPTAQAVPPGWDTMPAATEAGTWADMAAQMNKGSTGQPASQPPWANWTSGVRQGAQPAASQPAAPQSAPQSVMTQPPVQQAPAQAATLQSSGAPPAPPRPGARAASRAPFGSTPPPSSSNAAWLAEQKLKVPAKFKPKYQSSDQPVGYSADTCAPAQFKVAPSREQVISAAAKLRTIGSLRERSSKPAAFAAAMAFPN